MLYVARRVSKHNDQACRREREVNEREHATQQGIESDEGSVQQYLRFDVNYSSHRPESGSQALKLLDLMPHKPTGEEADGRQEYETRL